MAARSKIKSTVTNATVVLVSLLIGLLLCEVGARLFLNPADYLSVTPVRDDILGIRVASGSAGYDDWGFRNRSVPAQVDIVAVGDSHTYGNNATMDDSWPYVAGRLTGRSVYNLGLGGYGPNQYSYLLKTKGLQLKPKWVLCGIYLGDDFENAFLITYGKDYWAFLRKGEWGQANADIWETAEEARGFKRVRNWLSAHSVVYRVVVHGPLLGQLKGKMQIQGAAGDPNSLVTTLTIPEANIQEAFRPVSIRKNLDQSSGPVREGMRLTLELVEQMAKNSQEQGAQFAVALIPTKESVFAQYLVGNSQINRKNDVEAVIQNEQAAREQLIAAFEKAGIPYVDTLPALRSKVGNQLYTRTDRDMHPAKNGYQVIGEAVAEFLRSRPQ